MMSGTIKTVRHDIRMKKQISERDLNHHHHHNSKDKERERSESLLPILF